MAKKKDQKPVETPDNTVEETEDSTENTPSLNTITATGRTEPVVKQAKKSRPAPAPKLKRQLLPGLKSAKSLPLSALADKHRTPAVLLAAVKAEHGWNDETKLTEAEYRSAVKDWLSAPAAKR